MSITNLGNQYITFDYKHPATAKDFNTLLKGAIKPGIYSGGDITITGANTISVAPFIAYLYSDTDKLVRVETRLAVALTIAEATPVLSITFPWANVAENWLDWNQRAHGSAVITNEVCLGEMVFVASAINSIDYTVKNYGLYNEDGILRIPITTGTAPIEINSSTLVTNLNAEFINGFASNELVKNDYVISTQTEFDIIFNGTIPENTSIFLKKKSTPYLLNYAVVLSSGVKITSDGAVVNRGVDTARFSTNYKNSLGITSGSLGDTYFTMDSDATGVFSPGDVVSFNGYQFYTVSSISSTQVNIFPALYESAPSGSSVLYSYQQNILTEGWTFDGQNNVNGMGGSYSSGFTGSGGAFNLQYCANSAFKIKVQNCLATSQGGAYYGDGKTYNLIIENISNCSATSSGGAVCNCDYSQISNITSCSSATGGACSFCGNCIITNIVNCTATSNGGGCNLCNKSKISQLYYCSAGASGGGCSECDYSEISDLDHCTALTYGGGCYDCNYCNISNVISCLQTNASAGGGGGCYSCSFCKISVVENCDAYTGGGCEGCNNSSINGVTSCTSVLGGGGCFGCEYSTITNVIACTAGGTGGGCYACGSSVISIIQHCTATGNGGGCHSCNFATISNITGCTGASGGGCHSCNNVFLSGFFNNEGTVDNIANCTYMGQFTYTNNDGTDIHVQTTGTSLTTTDLH